MAQESLAPSLSIRGRPGRIAPMSMVGKGLVRLRRLGLAHPPALAALGLVRAPTRQPPVATFLSTTHSLLFQTPPAPRATPITAAALPAQRPRQLTLTQPSTLQAAAPARHPIPQPPAHLGWMSTALLHGPRLQELAHSQHSPRMVSRSATSTSTL
jgi:hypothetical protein